MSDRVSAIWEHATPDFVMDRIRGVLHRTDKSSPLEVFFRADDIAHTDKRFCKMMHTFLSYETPLCLAVVPDWLDKYNWKAMQEFKPESRLWCWHQHGKRHSNHEPHGKKCEFGDSRSKQAIKNDLRRGSKILVDSMGDLFFPVFTPPWNRCNLTTLELLKELDFKAVSRSKGAKPLADDLLPDIAVNVDLHTRKEKSFADGWNMLAHEVETAAKAGRLGIMLHHQRMNEEAFTFLELLLAEIRSSDTVSCVSFRELL